MHIFEHEGVKFDEWLGKMLDVGKPTRGSNKKKKLKLAAVRRQNQRFIARLVEKVKGLIHKTPASPEDASKQAPASQPVARTKEDASL